MLDKLFYNAKFYSLDDMGSIYSTLGVTDGKISYLGNENENIESKEKIDLNGKTVLPGFADTHIHVFEYANQKRSVNLFNVSSVKEIQEKCKEHYTKKGLKKGWLIGNGWSQNFFTDGRDFLYKKDLDEISTEYPIVLTRACVHVAVANSKALELILNSSYSEEFMPFIDIENGILKEGAVAIHNKLIEKEDIEDIKKFILDAHRDLLAAGITQVHSADLFTLVPEEDWKKMIKAYEELDAENKLKVKTYEQCMFMTYKYFEEFAESGYTTGKGSEFFKIGPLKIIADGSLGARTAYMVEPYSDDKNTSGLLTHSIENLRKFFEKAKLHNMQIAVHAIGDKAAELIVDLINEYNKDNLNNPNRDGLVHAQILSEKALEKMKKGNVTAYVQPVFIDDDMIIAEDRLGSERIKYSYAWKKMIDNGLLISGGSDSPVVSFNIMENIYFAVTRKNIHGEPRNGWQPQEKLSVDQAIKLFTKNAAYHSFDEKIKGTLEIGKVADLVVLNENIYKVKEDEIKDIKIDMTIVDGNIVYNRL